MRIYGLIQGNIVIAELSLVSNKESYFSMSTGYKVIYPKNIRGTIVTSQHDMHFYGANKAVY